MHSLYEHWRYDNKRARQHWVKVLESRQNKGIQASIQDNSPQTFPLHFELRSGGDYQNIRLIVSKRGGNGGKINMNELEQSGVRIRNGATQK